MRMIVCWSTGGGSHHACGPPTAPLKDAGYDPRGREGLLDAAGAGRAAASPSGRKEAKRRTGKSDVPVLILDDDTTVAGSKADRRVGAGEPGGSGGRAEPEARRVELVDARELVLVEVGHGSVPAAAHSSSWAVVLTVCTTQPIAGWASTYLKAACASVRSPPRVRKSSWSTFCSPSISHERGRWRRWSLPSKVCSGVRWPSSRPEEVGHAGDHADAALLGELEELGAGRLLEQVVDRLQRGQAVALARARARPRRASRSSGPSAIP